MRVAAVQTGPYAGSFEAQMAMIESAALAAAEAHSPRLLVLPELFNTPYFCTIEDPSFFERYAETVPGRSTDVLARIARQTGSYVVGSLFERRDGKHYNTAAVLSPEGELVCTYGKTHVPMIEVPGTWCNEKFYFSPGERLVTFELDGVKVGLLICYDRSFPEAWRALVLDGAQVVVVLASSSGFRYAQFVSELQTRSLESGVWTVACNKAGEEQMAEEPAPKTFYGRSCLIDPTGALVEGLGDQPGLHVGGDLDIAKVAAARQRLNYLRDRRPDLYGNLTK